MDCVVCECLRPVMVTLGLQWTAVLEMRGTSVDRVTEIVLSAHG